MAETLQHPNPEEQQPIIPSVLEVASENLNQEQEGERVASIEQGEQPPALATPLSSTPSGTNVPKITRPLQPMTITAAREAVETAHDEPPPIREAASLPVLSLEQQDNTSETQKLTPTLPMMLSVPQGLQKEQAPKEIAEAELQVDRMPNRMLSRAVDAVPVESTVADETTVPIPTAQSQPPVSRPLTEIAKPPEEDSVMPTLYADTAQMPRHVDSLSTHNYAPPLSSQIEDEDTIPSYPSVQQYAASAQHRPLPPLWQVNTQPQPLPVQTGNVLSAQTPNNTLVVSTPTYREAIRGLGPDVKIFARRPRTPGFLLTHPINFFRGRRWVWANEATGGDALDIVNAINDGEAVKVKVAGQKDTVDIQQVLQSADKPFSDKEVRIMTTRPDVDHNARVQIRQHRNILPWRWRSRRWVRADRITAQQAITLYGDSKVKSGSRLRGTYRVRTLNAILRPGSVQPPTPSISMSQTMPLGYTPLPAALRPSAPLLRRRRGLRRVFPFLP